MNIYGEYMAGQKMTSAIKHLGEQQSKSALLGVLESAGGSSFHIYIGVRKVSALGVQCRGTVY